MKGALQLPLGHWTSYNEPAIYWLITRLNERKEQLNPQNSSSALLFSLRAVRTVMKTVVLIALVSISLGILLQNVVSEEPVEIAVNKVNDEKSHGGDVNAERETIDSSDWELEEELKEDNAHDEDDVNDEEDEGYEGEEEDEGDFDQEDIDDENEVDIPAR